MTPAKELDGFIGKYTPEIAAEYRSALARMRKLVPGGIELVYDNYNGLVVGFGPSERASEAVLSLLAMPRWVTLCFLYGVGLPDPHKLLKGEGSRVRHVRLKSSKDLSDPWTVLLIEAAIAKAKVPFGGSPKRRTVIKSVSAKQRPRRPK